MGGKDYIFIHSFSVMTLCVYHYRHVFSLLWEAFFCLREAVGVSVYLSLEPSVSLLSAGALSALSTSLHSTLQINALLAGERKNAC